jgi:hypothetical protein
MLATVLIIAALICALLAALDVRAPRVHLGWIALALYFLSLIVAPLIR